MVHNSPWGSYLFPFSFSSSSHPMKTHGDTSPAHGVSEVFLRVSHSERVSRPALSIGPCHAKAACLLRRDFKRFNTCSMNYATSHFSAACVRLSPAARGTFSVSLFTEQELMARHGIREEVHALPFSCSVVSQSLGRISRRSLPDEHRFRVYTTSMFFCASPKMTQQSPVPVYIALGITP